MIESAHLWIGLLVAVALVVAYVVVVAVAVMVNVAGVVMQISRPRSDADDDARTVRPLNRTERRARLRAVK